MVKLKASAVDGQRQSVWGWGNCCCDTVYSLVNSDRSECQSCRPLPMSARHVGPSAKYQARSHGGGGGRGGLSPPMTNLSPPPRLPVPFAVTIAVLRFIPPPPPPEFCQPPLLTIPGYGAAKLVPGPVMPTTCRS